MNERVRANERAREGNVRGKRSAGSRAGGSTVRACPEGTKPERGRFERGFARLRRRLSASLCGSRSRGRTVSAVPTASRADDDGTHRVQRDERRRLRRGLQAEVDLHVRAARGVLRGAHRGTRVAAAGTTTARARDTGKKETGRESTETSFCLECRFVSRRFLFLLGSDKMPVTSSIEENHDIALRVRRAHTSRRAAEGGDEGGDGRVWEGSDARMAR